VTIADVFSAGGYRTGMSGKRHLGDNYPFRPEDRGFQEVLRRGGWRGDGNRFPSRSDLLDLGFCT